MRVTIRITDLNPGHARLSIWLNGGLICSPGGICVRTKDELPELINRLQPGSVEWKLGDRISESPIKAAHLKSLKERSNYNEIKAS